MQQFIKQRATETGDISFVTPAIDVAGIPLIATELVVFDLQGTTPSIAVQVQGSNDLETWTDNGGTGATISRTSVGTDSGAVQASANPYGRYIRYKIDITGTTTRVFYSLVLNTYQSS